jgi:hypothetical protein
MEVDRGQTLKFLPKFEVLGSLMVQYSAILSN